MLFLARLSNFQRAFQGREYTGILQTVQWPTCISCAWGYHFTQKLIKSLHLIRRLKSTHQCPRDKWKSKNKIWDPIKLICFEELKIYIIFFVSQNFFFIILENEKNSHVFAILKKEHKSTLGLQTHEIFFFFSFSSTIKKKSIFLCHINLRI